MCELTVTPARHIVVTATDQAVEELIKQSIAEAYPSHAFIGEESFAGGASAVLGDEPTWIVDPIGACFARVCDYL